MDRLVYCPGSLAAEKGLPELPRKDGTTDTGNKVHAALETGDNEGLEMSALEIMEHLVEMENHAVAQFTVDFNLQGTPKIVRETRFWIWDRNTLDPVASAKPDVAYVFPTHALVVNYKTGFKTPTASEVNWQSRTEVVALWSEYPSLEVIRGATAQSRLSSHFDSADYHEEDLRRIEREIMHASWRARQPGASRVPGEWCRWCRAQAFCRECATYAMVVQAGLPAMPDQLGIVQAIQRLTPAELGFIYRRKSTIEVIFDSVKARLQNLPEADLAAAGYTLGAGNNYTKVADVPKAFSALSALLTDDERIECIDLTMGRVIDKVATKQNISAKKAKELVHATLAEFLSSKVGNPKLKPIHG